MKKLFQHIDTNIEKSLLKKVKNSFTNEEIQTIKSYCGKVTEEFPEHEKLYYFSGYNQKYKLYVAFQKNS